MWYFSTFSLYQRPTQISLSCIFFVIWKDLLPGTFLHYCDTSCIQWYLWLEYENAYSQAILKVTLTWIHLCGCKLDEMLFGNPAQNIPRNLCTAVPVMGFLVLKALVSQKEPKLALSGYSGRLSSLLVLTQCPVTKKRKSSNIPFPFS